jgi:hypothetical protein
MNGRVAQNEPGMIEIRSLGHPFSGRALATDSVSLIVPVDVFTDRGGLTTASNNVVLGGHRANLLIDHLSSVEANLDRFTHDDLPGVKDRLRARLVDGVAFGENLSLSGFGPYRVCHLRLLQQHACLRLSCLEFFDPVGVTNDDTHFN